VSRGYRPRALGMKPAARTSFRKGVEIFPSSRTLARADMSGRLKTRIGSTSPDWMTSPVVVAWAGGSSLAPPGVRPAGAAGTGNEDGQRAPHGTGGTLEAGTYPVGLSSSSDTSDAVRH